ncbi:MAG: hypothetical protein SOZ29_01765, partial [Prevotella sp.]|nr:hypothetical protein [Prevotella sp.]MDY3896808.1 hypothetical protein [Prevotella sp.]
CSNFATENSLIICKKITGDNMGGGALLITSDAFIRAGKEDERFYGWGYEDWNRLFHPIK